MEDTGILNSLSKRDGCAYSIDWDDEQSEIVRNQIEDIVRSYIKRVNDRSKPTVFKGEYHVKSSNRRNKKKKRK
jgi:hypothetical protein